MALPFFYVENLENKIITLDEDTSKHINVLRMQKGEQILLTDGKGKKAQANIIDVNRKKCAVEIYSTQNEEQKTRKVSIAISLLKNTARFEWFLEKATEIGVSEIIPIICNRTEKQNFKLERMNAIVISAMLQSQQCWLPVLHQPVAFAISLQNNYDQKFIAHCMPGQKTSLISQLFHQSTTQLILIGPEGDFTQAEIEKALLQNFQPVTLGKTRLRTETAGIVAVTLLMTNATDRHL
ncbi:MAG TPA: RsmE family RNA methyltransferase [Chitinophagaceae bacterium]|nr:RsmE family RNA methyltransferase [Chitinophagaceae bacterium]